MSDLKYRIFNIKNVEHSDQRPSVLIIYTGGTLGMIHDKSGALVTLNFNQILKYVPSLRTLNINLTVISFPNPVDSSNICISHWQDIGFIINENYHQYDGFVVLHGTDTMSFTASALSFMLEGLNKPVIFTGAQLPVSAIRTDARANLVTALEIAAAKENGKPIVPEVCVYFDYQLMRGNRTFKKRSSQFAAFGCENYPILAKAGIKINYFKSYIKSFEENSKLVLRNNFDPSIISVKLFPSLRHDYLEHMLNTPDLKGVVLETYGSGNATTDQDFLRILEKAIKKNIIIFNVSQLIGGIVVQGRYETSKHFIEAGVISGADITREAAIAKFMFLLGNEEDSEVVRRKLSIPLSGEMARI